VTGLRPNALTLLRALGCLSVVGLMLGCVETERKLTEQDCHTKKLESVDACNGLDDGFQECHFYFRALGTPNRDWCTRLQTSARTPEQGPMRCDFDKPETFTRVECATHGVFGNVDCYMCGAAATEATKAYVYAYRKDCSRGLEQVTCNVRAEVAATKLGRIDL
jgi:hypothetical protein